LVLPNRCCHPHIRSLFACFAQPPLSRTQRGGSLSGRTPVGATLFDSVFQPVSFHLHLSVRAAVARGGTVLEAGLAEVLSWRASPFHIPFLEIPLTMTLVIVGASLSSLARWIQQRSAPSDSPSVVLASLCALLDMGFLLKVEALKLCARLEAGIVRSSARVKS